MERSFTRTRPVNIRALHQELATLALPFFNGLTVVGNTVYVDVPDNVDTAVVEQINAKIQAHDETVLTQEQQAYATRLAEQENARTPARQAFQNFKSTYQALNNDATYAALTAGDKLALIRTMVLLMARIVYLIALHLYREME